MRHIICIRNQFLNFAKKEFADRIIKFDIYKIYI